MCPVRGNRPLDRTDFAPMNYRTRFQSKSWRAGNIFFLFQRGLGLWTRSPGWRSPLHGFHRPESEVFQQFRAKPPCIFHPLRYLLQLHRESGCLFPLQPPVRDCYYNPVELGLATNFTCNGFEENWIWSLILIETLNIHWCTTQLYEIITIWMKFDFEVLSGTELYWCVYNLIMKNNHIK